MKSTKFKSNKEVAEQIFRTFLDIYDLEGANFYDTPKRVAKMWNDFFLQEKPILRAFPSTSNEMVVVKDFIHWGFCPHHLMPVRYTFKVGYIPNGKVIGLSKIPRLAAWCLAKLPLQEDLPQLLLNELDAVLNPQGLGCMIEGFHLCCAARGIKSETINFKNTALRGLMLLSPSTHQEFLDA